MDDILIRYLAKDNMLVESDGEIIASLDTKLTDELKDEGMAREIIRNIQDSRKSLDCEISDHIKIKLEGYIPQVWVEYICNETLSVINNLDEYDLTCEVTSNGNKAIIYIKK